MRLPWYPPISGSARNDNGNLFPQDTEAFWLRQRCYTRGVLDMRTNLIVVLMSAIFSIFVIGCADIGTPIDEGVDQPAEFTPPLAAPAISWTMSRHLPNGKMETITGDSAGYILREGTDYTLSISTDWDGDEVAINLISINCTIIERTSRSVTFRYELPDGQCSQDVAPFVEATRMVQHPIRYFRDSKIVQAIVVAN